MAVVAPAGVVGRVTQPAAHASLVQLIIDGNAAAGAVIERTRVRSLRFASLHEAVTRSAPQTARIPRRHPPEGEACP